MTRREEINQQAEEYRQPYRDGGYRLSSKDVRDAFEEGAEWADKTMIEKACDKLSELKSAYEKDLDAEPRIYERDIQLFTKIALINRIIVELEEEYIYDYRNT